MKAGSVDLKVKVRNGDKLEIKIASISGTANLRSQ
jgi:hypothetical protein